jgi:hypothetical protein
MLLYTEHDIDFDITKTRSDIRKSPYYIDNWMTKPYDWLFSNLPTKNVIWCHPNSYDSVWEMQHGIDTQRWVLDVPEDKVIAYLNRDAWDLCINNMSMISNAEYNRWGKEFDKLVRQKKVPKDTPTYDKYIDAKIEEYDKKHGPKEEQWKKKVFRKKINSAHRIEVLIPSPVNPKWVVDKIWYSRYDTEFHDSCHATNFKNTDAAIKYLDIVKSYFNGRKLPYKLQCEGFRDGTVNVSVIKLWESEND